VSHDIQTKATVLILSTSAEAFFEQVLDSRLEWDRASCACGCCRPLSTQNRRDSQ